MPNQNKVTVISASGVIFGTPLTGLGTMRRKLVAVTMAQLGGAGALLQLYDAADGSDATKLIYQVDGTVPHASVEVNMPFSRLYAKVSNGGIYNVIIN